MKIPLPGRAGNEKTQKRKVKSFLLRFSISPPAQWKSANEQLRGASFLFNVEYLRQTIGFLHQTKKGYAYLATRLMVGIVSYLGKPY